MWAPAGHAGTGESKGIVCTGTNTSAYDPPLTLAPQTVRIHANAQYACAVAPGRTVPATGSFDVTSPGSSCVALTQAGGTETVRYEDHTWSRIEYSGSTTARVAGVLVTRHTGRIAKGRGEGLPAERVVLALPGQLPTDCLTTGLRGNTSPIQLSAL
ncbi:hypothetical protein CTZ27_19100 [Streptomyces griseocarneus]|nr:hypothetical protein CTZ27_19100 [Streptomyces griseocarneus]